MLYVFNVYKWKIIQADLLFFNKTINYKENL
jgi:hypothetical protein